MSLSCSCDTDYDSYYAEWHEAILNISGAECRGCGKRMKLGDEILKFYTYIIDEEGNEVYEHEFDYPCFSLCSSCRDIYWSLIELKFCLSSHHGFIKEAHRDYIELYSKKTVNE